MPQYKGGRNLSKSGYGGPSTEPKYTGRVTKIIGRNDETIWQSPIQSKQMDTNKLKTKALRSGPLGQ